MINVVFYGYKSKNLLDACLLLKSNASNKNNYYAIDQSNINKLNKFSDYQINYRHVKWDSLYSKYFLIKNMIAEFEDNSYLLLINDAIYLNKDWDNFLINNIKDNEILSGYHQTLFEDEYKFFPAIKYLHSKDFKNSGWIEDNIIFGKKRDIISVLDKTDKLKQHGFNIISSLNAFVKKISVISLPTDIVDDSLSTFNTQDYYPFSRTHNYNEVIRYVNCKESIFGTIDLETIKNFNNKILYGINQLSELPFISNDIEYDPKMNIDSMSEKRFLNIITSIE